jgi:hypothetical protein
MGFASRRLRTLLSEEPKSLREPDLDVALIRATEFLELDAYLANFGDHRFHLGVSRVGGGSSDAGGDAQIALTNQDGRETSDAQN